MVTKHPATIINRSNSIYISIVREAFDIILKMNALKNNEKILPLAYIGITDREGSGVFDPILNNNLNYDFYRIYKNLAKDINDILTKLEKGNYKALKIIHYFGFLQNDIRRIRQKCNEIGIFLIDECAHSMLSYDKRGKLETF